MTTLNYNNLTSEMSGDELAPQSWVDEFVAAAAVQKIEIDGLELSLAEGANGTLTSVRFRDAISASADLLESRTIAIYGLLCSLLKSSAHPWPIRLWNCLPAIHQQLDADRDRYMVFNGGRYKAFCQWWGGKLVPENLPTASGLGHRGNDLLVHCLSTPQPGIAIENPRQIPAFNYSKRYGRFPPCFARATLFNSENSRLLIGGTASIRGEESMHDNSLQQQTNETLANIASLIRAASPAQPDDATALASL